MDARVEVDVDLDVVRVIERGPAGPSGAVAKYTQTIGDGLSTSFVVNHNLSTRDVVVGIYGTSGSMADVTHTVQHTSTSTVTVLVTPAPATGSLRVVVLA